jgi:putative ABC transport system permease protein
MINHHLNLALSFIRSNKTSSILNIVGLSVTFMVFIFLGSYVINELNIGKSTPNSDRIFRIQPENGNTISLKVFELFNKVPEVAHTTFLMQSWSKKQFLIFDKQTYDAGTLIYANDDFFKVFTYKPIAGNLENALINPDGIILTQNLARKIFGNKNAIGQRLDFISPVFGNLEYYVMAIIDDLPQDDILQFSCILPHSSLYKFERYKENCQQWGSTNFEAYVVLSAGTDSKFAEDKLSNIFKQNAPDWLIKDFKNLSLNPFRDLYFDNSFQENILAHNNKKSVKSIGILALIILIAGAINFINLSTAQKEKKRKSIAICNTNGASKSFIFMQFLTESLLLVIVSLLVAIFLVNFTVPLFNQLSGKSFSFSFFLQFLFGRGYLFIPIALAGVCGAIISIYFQSGKYYLILKNKIKGKEHFRNGLLVAQFVVSTVLIAGTVIIQKQNRYMFNHPTGYQKNGIICIPLMGKIKEHTSAFRSDLLKIPGVSNIAFASCILGQEDMKWGMSITNEGKDQRVEYNVIQIDSAFLNLMGLKIIEGTTFSPISDKQHHHIFNQTALKKFGITNIEKARVSSYSDAPGNIIGVVQDFNYLSFHSPINPMAFVYLNPENQNYAYIKLSDITPERISSVLTNAKNVWIQFVPDWPFEYSFLDHALEKLYEKDKYFERIAFMTTMLAVFIACFGLLGITMFLIESKTKEIGIRKINGASVTEVMVMLNKNFLKWIIIAYIIATPIAWYAMDKWLVNFAYKTELSWWIFVLAGILVFVIVLLTVSWQSWRAASRNPVESLRYE